MRPTISKKPEKGSQDRGNNLRLPESVVDTLIRVAVIPVSGFSMLLASKLIIDHGGTDDFAAMTLIWSLLALLPFADLGLGAAVTNSVAESKEGFGDRKVTQVVLTALRILLVVALIIGVSACLVGAQGGWNALFPLLAGSSINADYAISCLFIVFSVALPLGLWQRISLGLHRNRANILIGLLSAPFTLLLAWLATSGALNFNLLAASPAVGLLVIGIAGTGFVVSTQKFDVKSVLRALPQFRRMPNTNIFSVGLPMVVVLIGTAFAMQTDRLVLSWYGTPTALAEYSLVAQLHAPALSALAAGSLSLWPVFARARSNGESTKVSFRMSLLIGAALGLVFAAGMIAVGPYLLNLVGSEVVRPSIYVVLAFAALLLVQGATLPSSMFLTNSRGLVFQAIAIVLMLIVKIPLSILLVPLGPQGPVIASIIAVALFQTAPSTVASLRGGFR